MNNQSPVHAPGTILQLRYLRKRIEKLTPGYFIEIGVGRGYISKLLLDMGWKGIGYELNPEALLFASQVNANAISQHTYQLKNTNWLDDPDLIQSNLVISCAVIEHLSNQDEERYFSQCAKTLGNNGMAIILVPASMKHWGIEDEIAGHYRRYTFESIDKKTTEYGWSVSHIAGLTYPLSNLLLPISNFLVERAESNKKTLPMNARTTASGFRNVQYKTSFPSFLKLILNEYVMFPFYILQKLSLNNKNALTIYAELTLRA